MKNKQNDLIQIEQQLNSLYFASLEGCTSDKKMHTLELELSRKKLLQEEEATLRLKS